jgi:hypothetical protein
VRSQPHLGRSRCPERALVVEGVHILSLQVAGVRPRCHLELLPPTSAVADAANHGPSPSLGYFRTSCPMEFCSTMQRIVTLVAAAQQPCSGSRRRRRCHGHWRRCAGAGPAQRRPRRVWCGTQHVVRASARAGVMQCSRYCQQRTSCTVFTQRHVRRGQRWCEGMHPGGGVTMRIASTALGSVGSRQAWQR